MLLSLSEDLTIIPAPSTAASSPSEPLGECANSISLSSTCSVVELITVLVPFTVKSPVTIRFCPTVSAALLGPIAVIVGCEASMPITALDAVKPVPANNVATSSIDSFLVTLEAVVSEKDMKSPDANTAADNPFISINPAVSVN